MRVGLIIPRFKHSAVRRNLLKRRLRELARTELIPSTLFVDLVIRIRPNAYEASFAELAHDVRYVLEQLERWRVINQQSSATNELRLDESREII
jgi:ribonuclease P protein component